MRWWETAIKHPNPLVLRGFQGRWDGDGVQFCAASNRDHCASQKQAAETLRAPRAQPGLLNNTYTHTHAHGSKTHMQTRFMINTISHQQVETQQTVGKKRAELLLKTEKRTQGHSQRIVWSPSLILINRINEWMLCKTLERILEFCAPCVNGQWELLRLLLYLWNDL